MKVTTFLAVYICVTNEDLFDVDIYSSRQFAIEKNPLVNLKIPCPPHFRLTIKEREY